MKATNRERQKKWRQKQVSNGLRTVTVMLSVEIKDLIDRRRKETGMTIAHIIETAVVNLLGTVKEAPENFIKTGATRTFKELSAENMQQISDDLKAIVDRFEKMAALKSSVTCNKKVVTNDLSAESKSQDPIPKDPLTTEIYRLVRLLNNMEVSPDEIAFTLNKRKFKTLSGSEEWKVKDVHEVLKDIHQKYGHINPLFSLNENP